MNVLSGLGHGWHNVINANGLTITAVGMLLVFISLTIISIIIGSTPYLLKIIERYFPEQEEEIRNSGVKKVSETEVVAAISAALCHNIKSSN
jgi:Na+-transporting methylmalonyl-CoA/oxaloacetate decarboxylase gamma subunit